MALFGAINKEESAKASTGGGNYVNKSGIYKITIENLFVTTSERNQRQFQMYFDYNGQLQTMWGAFALDKFDGTPLESGMKLFDNLRIIAGEPELDEYVKVDLPIGKGGAMKEVDTLEAFEDLEITIIAKENYFRKKDQSIGGGVSILAVFTADGQSADEILNETEAGVKLGKMTPYAEDVSYGKGVTAADVQTWKDSFKTGNNASSTPAPAPKPPFGKKH